MKIMASSISKQLEDLLNPLPKFTDPEDDHDEATKAKVIEKFDEDNEEDDFTSVSGLRKRSVHILEETDRRYAGKATSRKDLQKLVTGTDDEVEEDEEDGDDDGDSDELEDDLGDEEDMEEEEEEEEDEEESMGSGEDAPMNKKLATKLKSTDITFPKETDFCKLTEGMDDLGVSEEDEDEDSGEEDEESAEGSEEEDEEEEEDEDLEDVDAVMTFSREKVDEEVEKGKSVKNQLALWDQLLEGRIKIQKALATANQLPQPQTFPEFKNKGGAQFSGALKNSHKALKALQRSLLDLQDLLLYQTPGTRPIAQGKTWSADDKSKAREDSDLDDEDEEEDDDDEGEKTKGEQNGGPLKRKLEMSEYPDFMAKRFANFEPYRNSTLQKWYDKTRLTMGKTTKGFGSFDRNILTQVEHVLMDKERLVRRTQTRRSQFRVLGKPEITAPVLEPAATENEAVEQAMLKANAHLKDLDEEIFDDSDFYHQLLRELIERKTSAADPNDQVAMGRQWLAIQKLRSKIKKRVDTKASKGRKIRFHIHSKLVNFMAPVDHSSMHDEARTELYRSLFGGNTLADATPRA